MFGGFGILKVVPAGARNSVYPIAIEGTKGLPTISQAAVAHQACMDSRIAAGHDSVEICVHVIGPAFAQQVIRRGAAEAWQRLGAEPGVGRQW